MIVKCFALVLLFFALFTAGVEAATPSDFLIRSYNINLSTEMDFDMLFQRLEGLPGIDILAFVDRQNSFVRMNRRVDNAEFDELLSQLHELGEVTGFSVNSTNVFMELNNLQTELQVRDEEHARLMGLLTTIDNLENFVAVEARLVQVIAIRERIISRISTIHHETATFAIGIHMVAADDVIVEEQNRIVSAFMNSVGFSLNMMRGFALFFAHTLIPVGFLFSVGFGCFVIIRKLTKNRRKIAVEEVVENDEKL
ncbi:MAG: DUF4349 domain-containing protein [Turicibacter sp.]|nr:DUF4349 domain-containing protein [Turicibacter sp.]